MHRLRAKLSNFYYADNIPLPHPRGSSRPQRPTCATRWREAAPVMEEGSSPGARARRIGASRPVERRQVALKGAKGFPPGCYGVGPFFMPVATVGSVACLRCATGCGVDSPTGPMIPSLRADYLAAQQALAEFNTSDPATRSWNCCSDWWARVAPVSPSPPTTPRLHGQYIHIGADTFLNYDCVPARRP